MIGLLVALLAPAPPAAIQLAQARAADSAHTLVTPPGAAAPAMPMQGAGPGYVIGRTPNSQTVVTPGGGTATVTPNGNGTSTVQRSDGRSGSINTPRP